MVVRFCIISHNIVPIVSTICTIIYMNVRYREGSSMIYICKCKTFILWIVLQVLFYEIALLSLDGNQILDFVY